MTSEKISSSFIVHSSASNESQAAIDKLIADFAAHPALPDVLYHLADEYQGRQRHEQAIKLFQYIADNLPESEYVILSRGGVIMADIGLGNDANAQAAIDSLIADFNDHPGLPEAIFRIGEQYYNEAFRCEKEGLDAEAKDNFKKAIAVWERIITELPPSPITPQAYFSLAEYYRRLREYENAIEYYSIVVNNWPDCEYSWHAQFIVARTYKHLKRSGAMPESEADSMIKAAYERILQEYPNSPAAYDARKWLNYHQESNQGEQK